MKLWILENVELQTRKIKVFSALNIKTILMKKVNIQSCIVKSQGIRFLFFSSDTMSTLIIQGIFIYCNTIGHKYWLWSYFNPYHFLLHHKCVKLLVMNLSESQISWFTTSMDVLWIEESGDSELSPKIIYTTLSNSYWTLALKLTGWRNTL